MDTIDFDKSFQKILRKIKRYSAYSVDTELLTKAFQFSKQAHEGQVRKSGEPYFVHCMEVAKILADLRMDYVTMSGGLLHDVVEDTGITTEEVEDLFGNKIANLVDGVTKISELKLVSTQVRQAENFRKMLLSMVKDIRVILIKFADRLHNMRTLEHLSKEKQRRIAIETREIYAPLAHRLGVARIRWELEDLCLKVLDPEAYSNLVKKISDKREEREIYIRRFTTPIRSALKAAGIVPKITGRPKHFYSIYKKMQDGEKPFDEIYDLLAIRVTVKRVEECYFSLGIVHSHFTPLQDRFKDYIATPKSNMYQSLHTTVIGDEGKMVEVQIRTEEMQRTADVGVAAHWRYKEGKQKDSELDEQLVWLRQILEWQHDIKDPKEFMENLRIDLFQDEVFVFTPKGYLIKLPTGSTPVDFAFAVHSDIGMQCLAAKVNGRIVPLNHQLESGDSIEIITEVQANPNPDWIKFVRTSKARSRINRWLKESKIEQCQKLGEEIVTQIFKKWKLTKRNYDLPEISHSLGYSGVIPLYNAVGRGEVTVQNILDTILPVNRLSSPYKKLLRKAKQSSNVVKVHGLENLLLSFGKCCQPIPGDRILGYISQGNGVIIHRTNCKCIIHLLQNPEMNIDVKWDVHKIKIFCVQLQLLCDDRKNLLKDISDSISQVDTNILSIEIQVENHLIQGKIIIKVRDLKHLTTVITKVSKVSGVFNVQRDNGGEDSILEKDKS